MNYDLIKITVDAAALLLSIGAVVVAIWRTRQSEFDKRFEKGSARMDQLTAALNDHDRRIARTEQTVDGMPSREDLHRIDLHMTQMAGTLQRMEAVMEGNAKVVSRLELIVSRHEDHLLKKA